MFFWSAGSKKAYILQIRTEGMKHWSETIKTCSASGFQLKVLVSKSLRIFVRGKIALEIWERLTLKILNLEAIVYHIQGKALVATREWEDVLPVLTLRERNYVVKKPLMKVVNMHNRKPESAFGIHKCKTINNEDNLDIKEFIEHFTKIL